MKRLLLGGAILLLSACAATGPKPAEEGLSTSERQQVSSELESVKSGGLGQFISAVYHAGQAMEQAERHASGQSGATDSPAQALSAAKKHRQDAEQALEVILEPMHLNSSNVEYNRRRLDYLDALHLKEGVLPPTANLYFNFASSHLRGQEKEKLIQIIKFIRQYPIFALELKGYADTVGSRESNRRLAERRNQRVLATLRQLGMPAGTVVSVAMGEASGPDEQRNPDNRRVELRPYVHGRYVSTVPPANGNLEAANAARTADEARERIRLVIEDDEQTALDEPDVGDESLATEDKLTEAEMDALDPSDEEMLDDSEQNTDATQASLR